MRFAALALALVRVRADPEESSADGDGANPDGDGASPSPPADPNTLSFGIRFSFAFSRWLAARAAAASTSGARLAPLPALPCRNPCGSSSAASGRRRASLSRHRRVKSRKASLHPPSFSRNAGLGSAVIMKMTRMGCTSCLGGFTSAISNALTPSAQTSTLPSYFDSRITSGAIQCGVPVNVSRLLIVRVRRAATPKSASFTHPSSVSRMLLHFMSRCSLYTECR